MSSFNPNRRRQRLAKSKPRRMIAHSNDVVARAMAGEEKAKQIIDRHDPERVLVRRALTKP